MALALGRLAGVGPPAADGVPRCVIGPGPQIPGRAGLLGLVAGLASVEVPGLRLVPLLLGRADVEQALSHLRAAVDGRRLVEEGRELERAREMLEEAVALDPYCDAVYWLGRYHLAVGDDLTDIPANKKGNPKIGNFPYASGDITGATEQGHLVPLCMLGLDGADEVCEPVDAHIAGVRAGTN